MDKTMSKDMFPPLPSDDCPLDLRIRGEWKPSSFWVQKAQEAMAAERIGDAYYYWLEASNICRKSDKVGEYLEQSSDCLDQWRQNSII